jgi:hypothetical protein
MLAYILRTTAALAALLALAMPAAADGFVSLQIGSGGFGVTAAGGDWSPYGPAWADPEWSLQPEVVLEGYGEWTMVAGLGRVWRPWVTAGWQPYSHGRWVWTTDGWTWVAYEPWGWMPHHFGEWAYTFAGWVWIPGTTWHRGNVVWVNQGGYVGWYPYAPRGWSHASRGWHRGYDRGFDHGYDRGYADGWRDARYATWVEWRYLGGHDDVSRHAVTHHAVTRGVASSRVQTLAAAPSRGEVSRRGGVTVEEVRLDRRAVNINGRRVEVARPSGLDREIRTEGERTTRTVVAPEVSRRIRNPVAATIQPQAPSSDNRTARTTVRVPSGASRVDRSARPAPVVASTPSAARSPRTVTPSASADRRAISQPAPSPRTSNDDMSGRVPVSVNSARRPAQSTPAGQPSASASTSDRTAREVRRAPATPTSTTVTARSTEARSSASPPRSRTRVAPATRPATEPAPKTKEKAQATRTSRTAQPSKQRK